MRLLPIFALTAQALVAQAPAPFAGSRLGGVTAANPSGYGNVAFPGGRPQSPVPFTGSLGVGAAISGQQGSFRNGAVSGRRNSVAAYGYPVFVGGGYYDQGAYQQQQPTITIINNPAPPAAAPVVVINQNFATPPQSADDGSTETTHIFQPAPRNNASMAADSDAAPPLRYFLVAFKDHSVYSALAYWIEDKTLHYVTPQQTHNQASLDLIDMDFTKKLNQH